LRKALERYAVNLPFARNARTGARMIYHDRWSLRKSLWHRRDGLGRWKALRNMVMPRTAFHLIYIRKFGVKRWWTA
jgi:hypothetical protein